MRLAHLRIGNWCLLGVLATAGFLNTPGRADDQGQPKCEAPGLLGLPRAEYQGRRAALMKRIKGVEADRPGPDRDPLIVLRGAAREDRQDYEQGRFRQSSPFAYLTGVDLPGASLLLRPNTGKATLYLPGPGHGDDSATARNLDDGFANVASTDRFPGDVFTAIGEASEGQNRSVVYLLDPEPKADSNSANARFARLIRAGAARAEFKDLAPALAAMRKAKSSEELRLIRQAIAITEAAHKGVMRVVRPGLFEYQLEAKIIGTFLDRGALRPAFASIVGSGPNAVIPHYFDNQRQVLDGDLVVVDIGAEFQYYAADLTRTYPANGRFSPRQREIYQLVLDTRADVASRMKPGETRLREVTGWAREFMSKSPLRAKGRDGKEQTMDHFFIHGLSHYLGLDVHDPGDVDEPIEVGEVFTIEPGIYLKGENIGIRIEDDYVMTKDGPELLSKGLPSDPDEIERRIKGCAGDVCPVREQSRTGD
ncbi:MAG: aminopeptidase P N-terminal domain-containing protein [Isosphaeraceae bacterium]